MSTTNLFVELLVIGVGAACSVVLLVCSAFGTGWLEADMLRTYPALAAMLAVVYLLGIITDRMADRLFEMMFSGRLRARYFQRNRDYQDARRLVFSNSDRLADLHEYGRSRLRICRGWAFNAAVMAACLSLFLQRQAPAAWHQTAQVWGVGGCVALSLAALWSWRTLCSTEYLKIREHAEFLRATPRRAPVRTAA